MNTASVLLALAALLLAVPVPLLLSGRKWPRRAPGTALILWQAIALSGGISMIGALLLFGLAPFGDSVRTAVPAALRVLMHGPLPQSAGLIQAVSLAGSVLLTLHLLLNLIRTALASERQRRRHRTLVDLLSTPLAARPGTKVLDHEAPVAYCLPGVSRVTVLSEGLVQMLDHEELDAVIEHEQAHLAQQHHLVLLAFASWRSALPWFPIATRAQDAVALLIEMLADDRARARVGDAALGRTIRKVGSAEQSWNRALPTPQADLDARVARLGTSERPLPSIVTAAVTGFALLLVAAPLVVVAADYP